MPPATHIRLYTRVGCCLCDDALAILEAAKQRFPFTLELIDVDDAPETVRLHGERVPVIFVNGRERFFGRINSVLLERLLRAESQTSNSDEN